LLNKNNLPGTIPPIESLANNGNHIFRIYTMKLGSTHTSLGNLDKSLVFFEKKLRLSKELYDAYPNNVAFKNGLSLSYQLLGITYETTEKKAKAKECYLLSKKLLTELVNRFPRYVDFKHNLEWFEQKLGE
jgi:tetratricopeptide (TPR) repeat protein